MNEELKMKLERAYKILHMEGLAEDTIRGHLIDKRNHEGQGGATPYSWQNPYHEADGHPDIHIDKRPQLQVDQQPSNACVKHGYDSFHRASSFPENSDAFN